MTPQTPLPACPRGPAAGSVLAEAPLGRTQHGAGGGDRAQTGAAAARSRGLAGELWAWQTLRAKFPDVFDAFLAWLELGDRVAIAMRSGS